MNWQDVKINWKDVSKEAHAKWEKLTDDDLQAIGGKKNELISRLQERYAMDKTKAEREAEDFVKTLH